jgi:putative lipoprotein
MNKLRFLSLVAALTVPFLLTACGSSSDSVSGTITYMQRIALPDDAVITVQIQDTSLADVAATVIGEQVIQTEGKQVPFEYQVAYDPNDIQENHTYTMRVRITDGAGKLLFINDTAIPVITLDNPTSEVEIVVVPVQ